MWQGGEPSPGADLAGVSPVPEQMWQLVYSVQRMQADVQRSRNQGEQHAAELLLLADTKTRSTLLHALRAF